MNEQNLSEDVSTKNNIALAGQVDPLAMMKLLNDIKEWDINNKMKQGQFLLPNRLRKRLQEIVTA